VSGAQSDHALTTQWTGGATGNTLAFDAHASAAHTFAPTVMFERQTDVAHVPCTFSGLRQVTAAVHEQLAAPQLAISPVLGRFHVHDGQAVKVSARSPSAEGTLQV